MDDHNEDDALLLATTDQAIPNVQLLLVVFAWGRRVLDEIPIHRVADEPDPEFPHQGNALRFETVHPDPQLGPGVVERPVRKATSGTSST